MSNLQSTESPKKNRRRGGSEYPSQFQRSPDQRRASKDPSSYNQRRPGRRYNPNYERLGDNFEYSSYRSRRRSKASGMRRSGSLDNVLDETVPYVGSSSMPNSPQKKTSPNSFYSPEHVTAPRKTKMSLKDDNRERYRNMPSPSPSDQLSSDKPNISQRHFQSRVGWSRNWQADENRRRKADRPSALHHQAEEGIGSRTSPTSHIPVVNFIIPEPTNPSILNDVINATDFSFIYPVDHSFSVNEDLRELKRVITHNTKVLEKRLFRIEENQAFLMWKYQCLVHT